MEWGCEFMDIGNIGGLQVSVMECYYEVTGIGNRVGLWMFLIEWGCWVCVFLMEWGSWVRALVMEWGYGVTGVGN